MDIIRSKAMPLMQRTLRLIYPDQCVLCAQYVDGQGHLCGTCWRDMPFITGHVCDLCGVGLIGESDGHADHCDECLTHQPPWFQGRAALEYKDAGRRLVLGLKHGDRTDLIPTAASWMARAGGDILQPRTQLVPVPLHWSRLLKRRYNQAAELAKAIAGQTGLTVLPDALSRVRRTSPQDGMDRDTRFANIEGAVGAHPIRSGELIGSHVCLIDDVMTSGATLSACAQACIAAGARQVSVLVLARVDRTP